MSNSKGISLPRVSSSGLVIAFGLLAGCSATLGTSDLDQPAESATAQIDTLTVSKIGTGDGEVVSTNDNQIDCGARCIAQIPQGQQVTLEAHGSSASQFLGWSGACQGTQTCVLNMNGPVTVVANFKAVPVWRSWYTGPAPLRGLWASSPHDLWLTTDTSLWSWDGQSWTLKDTRTAQGESYGSALVRQKGGALFAGLRSDFTGQNCESSGSGSWCTNFSATNYGIAQYAAAQSALKVDYLEQLDGVYPKMYSPEQWAVWASPGSVYAALCKRLDRFDGRKWNVQVLPSCAQAVWGTSDSDYWLVGRAGSIVRGSTLAPEPSGTTQDLYGVWGSDPAHYFAVGQGGIILRWNGSRWELEHRASRTLRSIWGASAEDVWAVGDRGLIIHYDGHGWTEVPSGTTQDLHKVFGTGPAELWVLGTDGTILTTAK